MPENTHWRVVAPASWPAAPAEMSMSTHADIDECPRRWALGAAAYPEIWDGWGYPPRLKVAALAGSVVHLALERIARCLTRARILSLADPAATLVLRDLGGFTRVVEDSVDSVLRRFERNPRATDLLDHAERTLRGQVPSMRSQVQSMLVRRRLPPPPHCEPAAAATGKRATRPRRRLSHGSHPEIGLVSERVGWKGKVDLLVLDDDAVEITDFKTGAPDEGHRFQILVYATLWFLDKELNPKARVADRLVLAYAGHDVLVPAPSPEELKDLARTLVERRQKSESALSARPPAARPSEDACRYCGVRQLCDDYWSGGTLVVSEDGRFGDVELTVSGQHGNTSWGAVVTHARGVAHGYPALLRLRRPKPVRSGTTIRILDGAISRDPEDRNAPLIVTELAPTEIYLVER